MCNVLLQQPDSVIFPYLILISIDNIYCIYIYNICNAVPSLWDQKWLQLVSSCQKNMQWRRLRSIYLICQRQQSTKKLVSGIVYCSSISLKPGHWQATLTVFQFSLTWSQMMKEKSWQGKNIIGKIQGDAKSGRYGFNIYNNTMEQFD